MRPRANSTSSSHRDSTQLSSTPSSTHKEIFLCHQSLEVEIVDVLLLLNVSAIVVKEVVAILLLFRILLRALLVDPVDVQVEERSNKP